MLSSGHAALMPLRWSVPVPIVGLVKPNTYRDSVALMVLSTTLSEATGVLQASAMMATPANLEILRATGLFAAELAGAGPNDLCIAVEAQDGGAAQAALARAEGLLTSTGRGAARTDGVASPWQPRSLRGAVQMRSDANLALISVPGEHAALEARQALLAGLNVFLFSDNVALEDEAALKRQAAERGLLVMGPDCGTGLIGGVPLGFANAVRRGAIGVIGSSGTGLQEVTSLIHRCGEGVSHALGTGSHDLYAEVGGLTFLAAIDALAADPETRVLVAIAKPGDPAVQSRVLERLRASGKPAIVYFLGGDAASWLPRSAPHSGPGGEVAFVVAADLEHAALCAVALARGEQPPDLPEQSQADRMAAEIIARLQPGRGAVRGLFAGGTLAQETAASIARALGVDPRTAAGDRPGEVLRIGQHSILDLGDDAYTRGRPHPLIDPRLRNAELVQQAGASEVALFVVDVILGYGSHPDPAGALRPAVESARAAAEASGRRLEILASLCGTEDDSQGYQRQRAALEGQGVRVARSSSMAAVVSGRVAAWLAGGAPSAEVAG
jgi:succinyl-CoA synthetase alpha subunit